MIIDIFNCRYVNDADSNSAKQFKKDVNSCVKKNVGAKVTYLQSTVAENIVAVTAIVEDGR